MRAALRPVVVGLAVLGLAAAGATTAQASGGHGGSSSTTTTKTSWVVHWTDSSTDISRSIVFGPMLNGDSEINIGNKVLSDS
ncbi:hypothetical protein DY218_23370 [Streptomyces triticagri]|uniref:Uncharacterized protein n=1 Tax=Streptomyces triticagri TaxID=2293568 RepID=A0A372M034_9ACTN|nr:hypothetical protein [Streptomyces triticagri]RFU84304.1 hypothetical protein DY218_23370 [Streptomyces triticagri]